tara:strand:+ start:1083 stop:1715 length:633 start_codon:yes stop_codon:yes gene_type:complete
MEPIMAIKIPGTAFQGVRSFGAGAPEAGFYKVSIIKVETNPNDKPGKRRLHVQFEDGFRMFEFMNLPYDDNGNLFPGLAENQVKGQLGAIRTILESLGYDAATIEGAGEISDGWFLHDQNHGRHGYVEFVPGQKGVQGSFSTIKAWMNESTYKARKDAGVTAEADAPVATSAPAISTAAPVPPAASNGVAAPSTGATLPPAPSLAQGLAN